MLPQTLNSDYLPYMRTMPQRVEDIESNINCQLIIKTNEFEFFLAPNESTDITEDCSVVVMYWGS